MRDTHAKEIQEAPLALCNISYKFKEKKLGSSCSATLISKQIVTTAAHCFSAGLDAIDGNVHIRCGLIKQDKEGEGFVFTEEFKSSDIHLKIDGKLKSGLDAGSDFAFIKLDHPAARVKTMEVPRSLDSFKEEFLIPSPTSEGDFELRPDLECRTSGFGIYQNKGKRYFITSDRSPKNGMKAFLRGDLTISSFVIQRWGDEIEALRFGDSGGAFYCKGATSSDWKLIGVTSMSTMGKNHELQSRGTDLFAPTFTPAFLRLWEKVKQSWGVSE